MATNLQFGRFEWRPEQRQLLADKVPLALGARAFDLLCVLLEHRDRVMSKRELLERAWAGVVVEENNLSVQVSLLRKLLGEYAISTIPGRGYRWALPVHEGPSQTAAAPAVARPSLAVLPFVTLGVDAAQAHAAEALADDIASGLSHSPWMVVIAQSASRGLRSSERSVIDICATLGVRYLIQGVVRRVGPALRVTVELVHGSAGEKLWTERYDLSVDDLSAMPDDITAKIVGSVEPVYLKHEELRASLSSPRDRQHWDLLMRARWHYWRTSSKHNREAKTLLEQALALQPDDALATSMLAFCHATDVWSGWTIEPRVNMTDARRLAIRAVALDDRDSFAHFTLGVILAGCGQMERAMAEQRRALELYPHFAAAAAELGRLLAFSGRTGESMALTCCAISASPTDPRVSLWHFALAIASFVEERYRDAIRHASTAISHRPDWFFNHYLLAVCLSSCDEPDAAREALAEGQLRMPRLSLAAMISGHPFTNPAHRERYMAALRRIGWTEQADGGVDPEAPLRPEGRAAGHVGIERQRKHRDNKGADQ